MNNTMMNNGKKEHIIKSMEAYVDANNRIDITKFRLENSSDYSLLSHYFGSVNAAIESCGWIKLQKSKSSTKGSTMILRDKLAYDMLSNLRKKHTFEEIAQMYNVTKPAISQLYKALQAGFENANKENMM